MLNNSNLNTMKIKVFKGVIIAGINKILADIPKTDVDQFPNVKNTNIPEWIMNELRYIDFANIGENELIEFIGVLKHHLQKIK